MTELAEVFSDLVRAETRLYNVIGARLRAEHGVSLGQLEFLRFIGSTERCRVQDLAEEIALAVGATSKSVDRMVAAGFVRRTPHPDDRRSSILTLTEAGRRALEETTPTFEAALEQWLGAGQSARQIAALGRSVARIRHGLEDAGVGMPTG